MLFGAVIAPHGFGGDGIEVVYDPPRDEIGDCPSDRSETSVGHDIARIRMDNGLQEGRQEESRQGNGEKRGGPLYEKQYTEGGNQRIRKV